MRRPADHSITDNLSPRPSKRPLSRRQLTPSGGQLPSQTQITNSLPTGTIKVNRMPKMSAPLPQDQHVSGNNSNYHDLTRSTIRIKAHNRVIHRNGLEHPVNAPSLPRLNRHNALLPRQRRSHIYSPSRSRITQYLRFRQPTGPISMRPTTNIRIASGRYRRIRPQFRTRRHGRPSRRLS